MNSEVLRLNCELTKVTQKYSFKKDLKFLNSLWEKKQENVNEVWWTCSVVEFCVDL